MATTPDAAQEKWERKTSGDAWKSGIQNGDSYAEGLANFWGGSANDYSDSEDSWDTEVSAVSASEFDSAVSNKGDKWRQNAHEGAQNG